MPKRVDCRPGAAPREQQHPAAPGGEELGARHDARLRRTRLLHQHALGGDPRQHQPAARACLGQRGQGQRVERVVRGAAQARAQPGVARRAHQRRGIERPAAAAVAVPQGVGVGGETVQPRDEHERGEAAVGRRRAGIRKESRRSLVHVTSL